jgi:Protein kinase domain
MVKYQAPFIEEYFSDDPGSQILRRYVENCQSNAKPTTESKMPARKWMPEVQLNAQLDKLNIPGPNDPLAGKAVIRDRIFTRISELLRESGHLDWSLRPRTFCILRMLGCIDAMAAFIAEKRTDIFLPYNHGNLPSAIKGHDLRDKFIRLQEVVSSPQHLEDLEREGGIHKTFHHSADEYFIDTGLLGVGGFGTVDRVLGAFGLHAYARKRIHRGASALNDREVLNQFEIELKALKALRHRHLVKLVSSYTDPDYVGLIMTPVADMDLEVFLKRKLPTDVEVHSRNQLLRMFYGCLTSALVYLHSNGIRHKDIKDRNVLIRGTNVLLSDFGTASIRGEDGLSNSTGLPGARTAKYCSPEVADCEVNPHSSAEGLV